MGTLDEVAVYPVVLTPAQIASHYTTGTAPAIPAMAKIAAPVDGLRLTGQVPIAGTAPVATAFDEQLNRIYVSRNAGRGDSGTNGITVIDAASRVVIAQITTGRYSPGSIAVNPVTHLVYVTSATFGAIADHSTVKVIDGRTNTIVDTIAVGPGPKAIAVNSSTNRIYVSGQSGTDADASVTVIDGATNKFLTSIPIGTYGRYYDNPSGLAVNNRTNTVYATSPLDGTLYVIDGSRNAVVRSVAIGDEPTALAVNESTNTVYVTNSASKGGRITVVDGRSGIITSEVAVGREPRGVAVDPIRNLVYVTSHDGNVIVVDGRTNQKTQTLWSGENPYGVAVNSATRTVVVANSFDSNVSMFIDDTGRGAGA